MANEIVQLKRNVGTEENPIWENWYPAVVADAIKFGMDTGSENIIDYINAKLVEMKNDIIGGATPAFDTFKELEDYINKHGDVADALQQSILNKVDKEEGKGLSTNDFTDEYIEKLETLDESSSMEISSVRAENIGGFASGLTGNFNVHDILDIILNEKSPKLILSGSIDYIDDSGNRSTIQMNDIKLGDAIHIPASGTIDYTKITIEIKCGSYSISNEKITVGGMAITGFDRGGDPESVYIDLVNATGGDTSDNTIRFILSYTATFNKIQATMSCTLFSMYRRAEYYMAYRTDSIDDITSRLGSFTDSNALGSCIWFNSFKNELKVHRFGSGYIVIKHQSSLGTIKNAVTSIIDKNGFDVTSMFDKHLTRNEVHIYVSKYPVQFNTTEENDIDDLSFSFVNKTERG